MEGIFSDMLLEDWMRIFIDDTIVMANTRQELVERTCRVLQRLWERKLQVSMDMLQLLKEEVTFLGHLISHGSLRVDPERTKVINAAPFPAMRRDLRRWMGAAAYLRAFIPNFAGIAAPLTAEAAKRGPLPETPELRTAFGDLKEAIAKSAQLHSPVHGLPYDLFVDASQYAMSAALYQQRPSGKVPLAFYSKKLAAVQTR